MKTIAGSIRSTAHALSVAAMVVTVNESVPTAIGVIGRIRNGNPPCARSVPMIAHTPMPRPNPTAPAKSDCDTTMDISRTGVAPIARSVA